MKLRRDHTKLPETPKPILIGSLYKKGNLNIQEEHLLTSKADSKVICLTSQLNQGYQQKINARKIPRDFIRAPKEKTSLWHLNLGLLDYTFWFQFSKFCYKGPMRLILCPTNGHLTLTLDLTNS